MSAKSFIPRYVPNSLLLFFLRLLTWKCPTRRMEQNRAQNRRILAEAAEKSAVSKEAAFFKRDAYIENQSQWSAVRFAFYTMDYSGCEIIACCNALYSLGQAIDEREMAELIHWFEANGSVLFGCFGSLVAAIRRYFVQHGYEALLRTDTDPASIECLGRTCDTLIITVYNDADDITKQIHTMNVSKRYEGTDHASSSAGICSYYVHNAYHRTQINGALRYVERGPYPDLGTLIGSLSNGRAALIASIGIRKKGEECRI